MLIHFIELIDKVHSLIKHIKNSYYLSKQLENLCNNSQQVKHSKLISDVITRWNSRYYMLKRLLILKDVISELIRNEKEIVEELEEDELTEEEYIVIEILVDYLYLFNKCSKYMEGEYPTLGYSISLYYRLYELTRDYSRDDIPVFYLSRFRNGFSAVHSKIEKYYGCGTLFSFSAMIFDVRLKQEFYTTFLWVDEMGILIKK